MSALGRALRQLFGQLAVVGAGETVGRFVGGGFVGAAARLGTYFFGITWLSGLMRPPDDQERDAGTLSGTQNQARPWGHVPRVYGRTRIVPDLAATPVTEIIGNEPHMRLLLCCGYGPLRLSRFMFGDRTIGTPLGRNAPGRTAGTVDGVEMQISAGWGAQQDDLTLFNSRVVEQHLDKPLEYAASWQSRGLGVRGLQVRPQVIRLLSQEDSVRLGLDLLFPEGLVRDEDGDITGERVDISVRYRPYGSTTDSAWTYLVPDEVILAETATVLALTDTEIFGWIEQTNARLATIVAELESISAGTRQVSNFFRSWLVVSLGRNNAIAQALLDEEDLTTAQQNQLTTFQGHLNDIQNLLDTASDVTGDLADGIELFNDKLSLLIQVLEFVDSIQRVYRYIAQGVGPDLSTLNVAQRAIVRLRNATHLFGEAPTGSFIIANLDADPGQLWRSFSWEVTPGRYEVQVRRTSESHSTRTERARARWPARNRAAAERTVNTGIKDTCHVWAFRSYLDEPAVSQEALESYAFVAMRIKASEVWNGAVPRITCLAEAPIPRYADGQYTDPALTRYRNPAIIYLAILRGTENPSPVQDSQIDIDRIMAWADFCSQHGYRFDYSFDQGLSVLRSLAMVARAGRGSPTVRDGKYSVVWDRPQTPVALLTLRNVQDFRSQKSFAALPHGIRLQFRNEDEDYAEEEVVCYRDGYGPDGAPATLLETTRLPGVVQRHQAEELGKYLVRSAELRPEVLTFSMDWEHLTFERGDWITLQHDVVLWGLGSARITGGIQLSGGDLSAMEVDELVTLDTTKSYRARLRTADGVLHRSQIASTAGPTHSITFPRPLDLQGSTVAVGDLVAWGEARAPETIDCVVTEIRPRGELQASIRCVQASPAVFDLDGPVVYRPGISTPVRPELTRPHPPVINSIQTDESALFRDPQGNITARIVVNLLTLKELAGARQRATQMVDAIELQYRLRWQLQLENGTFNPRRVLLSSILARDPVQASWRSMPLFRPHETIQVSPVQTGQVYDLRVRAITATGIPSEWVTRLGVVVVGKASPPKNVESATYLDGVIRWRYTDPPLDLAGFKVRVLHGQGGNWEAALPAHEGVLRENSLRVGDKAWGQRVYFIKAVDTSGLQSNKAARVVFSLGTPPWNGLFVDRDHAAQSWTGLGAGTKEGCEVNGSNQLVQSVGSITEFYRYGSGVYRSATGPLYSTAYQDMVYQLTVAAGGPKSVAGYPLSVLIEADVQQGEDWRIEHRNQFGECWPDLDKELWPRNLKDNLWPERFNRWLPVDGLVEFDHTLDGAFPMYDFRLEFRFIAPGGDTQVIVNNIVSHFKWEVLEEYINGFSVAATGTVRLPVTKVFTSIESVSLTLEYSAGTASAVMAKVIDRDPDNGPEIQVYDKDGNRVAGIVDAHLTGV